MSNERAPEALVREVLFAFGKLGLLIEDAPDARLRTARELYGADGLPGWWLQFDNLEEGTRALEAAWQAVGHGRPPWAKSLPLLVILDRYLEASPDSSRASPWDDIEENGKGEPEIAQIVRQIQRLGTALPVHIEPVTSYSGPSHRSGRQGVDWQQRHSEPLHRLRRRLSEDPGLRPLLRFGPVDRAPMVGRPDEGAIFTGESDHKAALCRARYWRQAIDSLVDALASNGRDVACVLLTGAGASLANDPLAPGIPETWYLLEWACWKVMETGPSRKPAWPPEGSRPHPVSIPRERARSLQALCERYQKGASVRDLDWSLEELFKPRPQERSLLMDFAAAFRQALMLWDHDFPYHHWLLSLLPWNLIVTTNFDGFHERAAANATVLASPSEIDRVRRLGEAAPLSKRPADAGAPIESDFMKKEGPGLLKPYGSLQTSGPLELTHDDFWSHLKSVGEGYLEPLAAATRECWIVIVGHRLASDALHDALTQLVQPAKGRGSDIRLLWVEPSPYRNDLQQYHSFRHFADLLEGQEQPDPFSEGPVTCPLPARALDFAFDLWLAWEHRRRRLSSA